MLVILQFSQPRAIGRLELTLGSMAHFRVELVLTYTDNSTRALGNDYQNLPADPYILISLPENPLPITALRIAVQNMNPSDTPEYHIHIREIGLH